ncbi:blue copper protein-like [Rutidosis leptorrhynchoides]|uniref:blue copper protein-like n=1 Tax=Rutidosis leptorrhynchoides TaxID=125765 RepID=UPI003A98DAD8
MASFNLNLSVFLAIMVASIQFHNTLAQTRHVVGDALGWTIPSGGASAYTTWASQQTFTVGDVFEFNFGDGQHDVAEVSEAAYGPCTSTNPISLTTTGPASLTLTTTGTHYYICTFTSHCQIGQKLTINVSSGATTMPPPTTPASPPTTTMPPPTTTMPPPTTSASPPTTTPTPPSAMSPMTPTEPCPPTTSPSSSPTSPRTTTTTTTTNSMAPPSPPNSGANSFATIIPATFLAIGLAILNI